MRNEISLTDEQIEEQFDYLDYGITEDELVYSRETIADFLDSRNGYVKRGEIESRGDAHLILSGVQAAKGEPRKTIVVIDFGGVRAVYAG